MDPKLDTETWNQRFETPGKDIVVFRKEIINSLPVKEGEIIADVGAGSGQFEAELSKKVGPEGKVFAVEVAPAFIPYMKKRFEKEKLTNVEVIHSNFKSTTLKDKSVNLVFVVDTYHHFDRPVIMVKDFGRILKDKGHLVIIDFRRGPGASQWVNEHMHLSREDIIKEVTANGFEFLREERIPFKESFQLTFRKI